MFVMKIVNTGKYPSTYAHSCKYAHICTPRNKHAHMNIYIYSRTSKGSLQISERTKKPA